MTFADWSARRAAEAVATGDVRARDLTAAALRRIASVNTVLNAFLVVDGDEAMAAAEEADSSASDRVATPLRGVPLAHKDMFDRQGKVASWGARIHADAPAGRDAEVIARLKAAGTASLGCLNMAEFAFGITGHNYHVGHCRNPHDPAYITGGSSSGSASAVAAGLVPFALGSDTGGSVRVPAACCGIVGLRPTWGTISRQGAMPLAPSLDTVGPLARDIGDIALVLSLLAGDGGTDYLAALERPVAGLRIGLDRALLESVDAAVGRLLTDAVQVLRECGAVIVEVKLPDLGQLDRYAQILQFAEASAYHARWMRTRAGDYSDQVRKRLEDGYLIPATDYLQAERARPHILDDWLNGPFSGLDVLFLPTLGRRVPTIAETDVGGGETMATTIAALLRFTRPLSYLGLPCLALPTAADPAGIPNGFQLLGRPLAEPTLLALGAAYQRQVGVPAAVMPTC